MNQRKPNNFRWYSLGLVMLLLTGCFIISTGTTFARYRAESSVDQMYSVRPPEQICLGTVELVPVETEAPEGSDENTETTEPDTMKEAFVPSDAVSWSKKNGISQLEFAVANGNAEDNYSARTQEFHLRLIGTLGIWSGTETAVVQLMVPSEEDPETLQPITATVQQIPKDTPLHITFGDGWIYTFQDEQGEEIRWTLKGGSLQYVGVTITVDNSGVVDPSLLQLQIVGRAVNE